MNFITTIRHMLELRVKRWVNTASDYCMWKLGNCFGTREEAETKGKEIMEQLEKEYRES